MSEGRGCGSQPFQSNCRTGPSRTASRGLGGVPYPPGGLDQQPLREDAHRAAGGALANLG